MVGVGSSGVGCSVSQVSWASFSSSSRASFQLCFVVPSAEWDPSCLPVSRDAEGEVDAAPAGGAGWAVAAKAGAEALLLLPLAAAVGAAAAAADCGGAAG